MIKWEIGQQIDGLKDQIAKYKEIVGLQKDSLRLAKEKASYDKDVADKVKGIATLQNRINQLALDDSREAKAERLKLEEELAEQQSVLAETQADHAYDTQVDTLDKMAEAFEDEKNEEIKILEDSISSYERLYRMAIDRINTHWDTLYVDLINYNEIAGNSVNDEITAAWDEASLAVQRYGSYLEALLQTQNQLAALSGQTNNIIGGSSGSGTGNGTGSGSSNTIGNSPDDYQSNQKATAITEVQRLLNRLETLRAQWNSTTDKAERQRFSDEGKEIGEELSFWLQRPVVRGSDGVWYLDAVGGEKMYDAIAKRGIEGLFKYHTGTMSVGGSQSLKDNEILAVLEQGEAVLTKQQKDGLFEMVDVIDYFSKKLGTVIDISKLGSINIQPRDLLPSVSALQPSQVAPNNFVFNPEISVKIEHNGSMDNTSADSYGKTIANSTLSALESAFRQRGINVLGSAALRS